MQINFNDKEQTYVINRFEELNTSIKTYIINEFEKNIDIYIKKADSVIFCNYLMNYNNNSTLAECFHIIDCVTNLRMMCIDNVRNKLYEDLMSFNEFVNLTESNTFVIKRLQYNLEITQINDVIDKLNELI